MIDFVYDQEVHGMNCRGNSKQVLKCKTDWPLCKSLFGRNRDGEYPAAGKEIVSYLLPKMQEMEGA